VEALEATWKADSVLLSLCRHEQDTGCLVVAGESLENILEELREEKEWKEPLWEGKTSYSGLEGGGRKNLSACCLLL